ncbi:iron complex transport system ATP-binding protein [Desulfacinum hydrothermale DSM 13146]|uniref:Iron complex transport system ATP-binding protein n=1 Tax=Desulfacinum hydrothermale DSM 13146 TaxID=1121390 RepID=A0A1W1XXQ6_9BACT|nr:ABC transporter ATP-binding protein [Desulfacinum hydrothermale]SMC28749.1 iron complex transport system ATP-binding protein [Desulfacinum hydrothermale DSM 13146]
MIVSVLDILFSYDSHHVLRGVRFQVEAGQFVALCGTNGAGKSTLLRCINGLLRPRVGTVLLDGEDVGLLSRKEVARRCASVPQQGRSTELTVFHVVLLGRLPHCRWGPSRDDLSRVERILEEMNLAPLAHRPLSALSGGEAQKVLLARALAQDPRVLLLDEPTNHLDLKNQLAMMELIEKVARKEGLAAVAAIHDLNLALRHCDRLLFLKAGKIHGAVEPAGVTPDLIREVYGVDAEIERIHGRWVVIPQ